jgi:hypothetical protein
MLPPDRRSCPGHYQDEADHIPFRHGQAHDVPRFRMSRVLLTMMSVFSYRDLSAQSARSSTGRSRVLSTPGQKHEQLVLPACTLRRKVHLLNPPGAMADEEGGTTPRTTVVAGQVCLRRDYCRGNSNNEQVRDCRASGLTFQRRAASFRH